jgi:hypothetical protein
MSRQWIPEELEPTLTPRERALNELSKKKSKQATKIREQQDRQRQAQR